MDIGFVIENKKNELFKSRMNLEFEYYNSTEKTNNQINNMINNLSQDEQNIRKNKLHNIINDLNNFIEIKTETIQQKRENLFKEIDKYVFRKQWNKLTPIHQSIKIKEFISNNDDIHSELKNKIINELCKMANDGKINTKRCVVYDPNAEKILSIPILNIDNEKKIYNIKLL